MFVFFFRLQAVGGPVYLSQIGYVAAAGDPGTCSSANAMRFSWLGAAIIVVGVFLTTKAQKRG